MQNKLKEPDLFKTQHVNDCRQGGLIGEFGSLVHLFTGY